MTEYKSNFSRLMWWRDPKGYKLDDDQEYILTKSDIGEICTNAGDDWMNCLEWYNVQTIGFKILDDFLNIRNNALKALAFSSQYGLLRGSPLFDNDFKLKVSEITAKSSKIQNLLKEKNDGHQTFNNEYGDTEIAMGGSYSVRLFAPKGKKEAQVVVVPDTLEDYIWLEFLQLFAAGGNFQSCSECNAPFRIGPGARRTDAKYCSDVCKKSSKRRRRKSNS